MILLPYAGERRPWIEHMCGIAPSVGRAFVECGTAWDDTTYATTVFTLMYGHRLVPLPGGMLAIVEHDIWPTLDQLERLLDCPHQMCTIPYRGLGAAPLMGMGEDVWSCATGTWPDCELIEDGDSWASRSALGCVRFRSSALAAIGRRFGRSFPMTPWNNVDVELCEVIERTGLKWHVHWPAVSHRHLFEEVAHAG